ncbi:MAG: SDR family NAD(P)-dependent oxidoreductase [Bacteroidia bacterium]|nr:SDR family NAD(P)-dependent oxidoreductase [Bacteroidia bacterium]
MNTNRIALVTGATAGFGRSIARCLAINGFDVIITGRRKKLLVQLEEELIKIPGCRVLSLNFDVRKLRDVENAINCMPEDWKKIDVLVNNAGLAAGLGPVQDGLVDDWERMIDTNIKGLLYMTRLVAPLMVAGGRGHIVNIGSIAGREVYPNGNVYCGTKFAVDAISKGSRMDLVKQGIKVTVIHPGMAETEFSFVRFHGDAVAAKKVYDGLIPLHADDIADAVLYAVTRPDHVNISELVITPTAQASATIVNRV